MKKTLMIIALIIAAVFLIIFVPDLHKNRSIKNERNSFSQYYKQLAEDCMREKGGESCCMASVRAMQNTHSSLYSEELGCPDGFEKNMLRCINSYVWCQQTE